MASRIGAMFRGLFAGGGGGADGGGVADTQEYQGYALRATPRKQGGQWQVAGVIEKEVGGVAKTHEFVRADVYGSRDSAAEIALQKARRIVDEQGERMFEGDSS